MTELPILGNVNLFHTKFIDILDKYHYVLYDITPYVNPMTLNK